MTAQLKAFAILLPGMLSLSALHAAYAQDASQVVPAPAATVAVNGTSESIRRNDTAARIVINRAEILKYGDTSVLEVMRRLPGVTVGNGEVRMRGLGGGYTQVLVNGERPPAGFSLAALAPDSIERIEVMRAATAEFSTQSIAGTINVIMRRSASKKARELKVRLNGDGGDPQPGVTLNLSDQSDAFSYTGSMGLGRTGFETGSVEMVEERDPASNVTALRSTTLDSLNEADLLVGNARLHWTLPDSASLTWQVAGMTGRFEGATDERTVTVAGAPFPYPELDVRYERDFASLNTDLEWIARFGDTGKLNTKAKAHVEDNERFMTRLGRNDAAQAVLDRRFATDTRDKGLTWTGKFSFLWTERHSLAVGWDAGYGTYTEHEAQDDVPTGRGAAPVDFDNSFDATVQRLALYAQDEWDLSSALSVYLGVRWEGVDTRTSGQSIVSEALSRVWSPLFQALWKIPGAKNDQLRFALTRTYKAPALRQLIRRNFQTSFNTAVSPDFTGNPGLRPELAVGADLAYEHFWSSGGMVSASASVRRIDGLVRSAVRLDGDRWVSYPENSGRAVVRGLELEAKFPLKALIADAPALDLRASASRNWSEVDGVPGPHNRLNRQPRWSASFGADFKQGAFSAGTSLALVAGGWTRLSDTDERFESMQRDLRAYAMLALNSKSQLRLSLVNMLDTDSRQASRYTGDFGSLESRTVAEGYLSWGLQYEHRF